MKIKITINKQQQKKQQQHKLNKYKIYSIFQVEKCSWNRTFSRRNNALLKKVIPLPKHIKMFVIKKKITRTHQMMGESQ
jgi:hypothetical protein